MAKSKNIIGQGAIVRSLRKPRQKKAAPPAVKIEVEMEDGKKEEKDC